ncbi:uncharacterized protein BP01DRAFT_396084 [Aspergillus saccharolyticus JOP 1030-1]|uniref:Uncharacterized protein n=1 Tax=Aspergillus saccharolyticus JOP 1030-1 TaxID=1450539 RepID=A0A318ZXN0_9EURO|nr:hypothetical protein BP01DRAFT_396084 [Aspergillus saccharolyticus JOP 1030-1]PYH40172.1 hypothetical protein BP01DRAFT_396084 [Aspergillus saccharolyticus JOP 1030-1]
MNPSGLSAIKALQDEDTFDVVRVCERCERVGGIWHYDPTPDPFPSPNSPLDAFDSTLSSLPSFTPPLPETTTARTGIDTHRDSNVGAQAMAFMHTPFPDTNSAASIKQLSPANASRPVAVVTNYIENLFWPYLNLVSMSTTVERVEKIGARWKLTMRQSSPLHRGNPQDYG